MKQSSLMSFLARPKNRTPLAPIEEPQPVVAKAKDEIVVESAPKVSQKKPQKASKKPSPKKRGRKKKKGSDDEDEDFVVNDSEPEEEPEEDNEDELELFDDEEEDKPRKVASKKKKKKNESASDEEEQVQERASPAENVKLVSLEEKLGRSEQARSLEFGAEELAQVTTAKVSFEGIKPRETTDPQFPCDPKLHAAFAKKLNLGQGRLAANDDGDDGPSFDSILAKAEKRPRVKYTPLEEQFLAVKQKHKDVVLFVECGYKYRFFAGDAIIASNVLGIMCLVDKNFYSASVPVGRLNIHTERLVVAGYKVGVVRQTETAALKQGNKDTKNQIFSRELCEVYTMATFFGDAVVTHRQDPAYMACILDHGSDIVTIVAIALKTSDLVFDTFKDDFIRTQLETRLAHLGPVEFVLPMESSGLLSPQTDAKIKGWLHGHSDVRVTRVKHFVSADEARQSLTRLYAESTVLLDLLGKMTAPVLQCVSALGTYLKEYDLDRALHLVEGMRQWTRDEMLLSAETLKNLEVMGKAPGSLFRRMDRTVSAMGARLLGMWLLKPLVRRNDILMRQEALDAVLNLLIQAGVPDLRSPGKDPLSAKHPPVIRLMQNLASAGDLEQEIAAIFHRRCQPGKFVATLKAVRTLFSLVEGIVQKDDPLLGSSRLFSSILRGIVNASELKTYVDRCLQELHEESAKEPDWMNLFMGGLDESVKEIKIGNDQVISSINEARQGMADCKKQLSRHLEELRKLLKNPSLEYKSLNGREYLVEISRSSKFSIPSDWQPDQHTKAMFRYITPEASRLLARLNMFREASVLLAKTKWASFLDDFGKLHPLFRNFVAGLATIDCIFSFAQVSTSEGYCKPVFVADGKHKLHIVQGRHPVAETLLPTGSFIGNDVHLEDGQIENLIVTGPNMGGKSTFIRGVAQIVILAQAGCYVPAQSCELGVFDAIYTRMGAEDDLAAGKSTFFSELTSTSTLLESATSQSLVVIDELGRGTSTFDGTAIAYATLRYLAEHIRPLGFFVTHFPILGTLAATHTNIGNAHVAFIGGESQQDPITFLFQVRPGLETRSYGLNVARLAFAGQFDNILMRAAAKSNEMEGLERQRREWDFLKTFGQASEAVKLKNPKRLRLEDEDVDQ